MNTTNIVYPVEPGFLWLLHQDGLWGGWRDDEPLVEGAYKKEVAVVRCDKLEIEYRVSFLLMPEFKNGDRWGPRVKNPHAAHFDLWEPPYEKMHLFEKKYLSRIIGIRADILSGGDPRMGTLTIVESIEQTLPLTTSG